jgi:protein NRD1
MFRTHKQLPAASKISSLYAFDALARGAKDAIDKKKVEADPNATTGNCATFLLKLEGILESLVQDLLSTDNQEVKVSHIFS